MNLNHDNLATPNHKNNTRIDITHSSKCEEEHRITIIRLERNLCRLKRYKIVIRKISIGIDRYRHRNPGSRGHPEQR